MNDGDVHAVSVLEAVVKVLNWINESEGDKSKSLKQYELTLSLLGGNYTLSNNTYLYWLHIYNGWIKLSKIITTIKWQIEISAKIDENNIKRRVSSPENLLNTIRVVNNVKVKPICKSYNELIAKLSLNIKVYTNNSDYDVYNYLKSKLSYSVENLADYNEVIVILDPVDGESDQVKKDRIDLKKIINNGKWEESKKIWYI